MREYTLDGWQTIYKDKGSDLKVVSVTLSRDNLMETFVTIDVERIPRDE